MNENYEGSPFLMLPDRIIPVMKNDIITILGFGFFSYNGWNCWFDSFSNPVTFFSTYEICCPIPQFRFNNSLLSVSLPDGYHIILDYTYSLIRSEYLSAYPNEALTLGGTLVSLELQNLVKDAKYSCIFGMFKTFAHLVNETHVQCITPKASASVVNCRLHEHGSSSHVE